MENIKETIKVFYSFLLIIAAGMFFTALTILIINCFIKVIEISTTLNNNQNSKLFILLLSILIFSTILVKIDTKNKII